MKSVLLLGNGLNRIYNKHGISWTKLLEKMTTNKDIPDHIDLPFPLEIVLRTNDHVDQALRDWHLELYGTTDDDDYRNILTELLTMGFDEILTTNYDYSLEMSAASYKGSFDNWLKKTLRHTDEINRAENKYLLHTYQNVQVNGVENRIWHIHGEARKPGSMVIGHYMYINLVSKWRDKLVDRNKEYMNWDLSKPSNCWLDSFILGNVYILGLGMDFSEMDLWWLLNRKKREKANPHGKVVFYEPQTPGKETTYALLRAYDVEVRHLGYKLLEIPDDEICEEDMERETARRDEIREFNLNSYSWFYKDAIIDIQKDINECRIRLT